MNIAIPLGGQIRMVICSSFVIAKRKDATHYDLSVSAQCSTPEPLNIS